MLLIALLLAVMLTAIGWYVARDLFAPFVAAPAVWAAAIIVYYVLPAGFYPIERQFPFPLIVWLSGFFVTSLLVTSRTAPASDVAIAREPNRSVLRFYIAITLTVIPLISFMVIWKAFTTEPETMFRYMRVMNTGRDENVEPPEFGPLIYFTAMAFVMMFFAYLYFRSKWVIGSVVFMNLLFAFITMSKTVFLSIIFSSLYFLYTRGKIKLKHMVIGIAVFAVFAFILQTARQVDDDVETAGFLSLYLSSSMVAFDYFAEACSSVNWGANTFRLFYAVGHAVGLTSEPTEVILPFVSVPDLTNTYTNLYPFYTDFGTWGVFVFSIIYGAVYGYFYKKSQTGGKMQLILYAIFLTFLLLEFIGEFIFTNLSMFLQYMVFAVFPFFIKGKSQNAEVV